MPGVLGAGVGQRRQECLVVVANYSDDPLPDPPPNDFDPPAYRQVAQKNLTVVAASMQAMFRTITVSALQRTDKLALVTAQVGGELDALSLRRLGLSHLKPASKGGVEVGLSLEPRCVGDKDPLGSHMLELRVPRGQAAAVYASIRAKQLTADEYQLVHLVERNADKIVGGLAFVVVAER